VKELHEAAAAWQHDVSNVTTLSLKGVKRRSQQSISPVPSVQPTDVARTADQSNVAELSNDPILLEVRQKCFCRQTQSLFLCSFCRSSFSKVFMPRENAMQTMLSATSAFESLLCDFLGKDYEGLGPDRAAYPSSGSLSGTDGSFILYRLTRSPLFGALRESIDSISEVVGNVFSDSPGKAAFDWIRNVVYWIESLHQSVRVMNLPYGGMKLVIPCLSARQLLESGNHILLDVPNDLRKTLSKHKIFISTNNLGKLTVRTMKGGAHHAVGVTAIRWGPLLFDALKSDYSRYEKWQKDMGDVAGSFVSYSRLPPTNYEESVLLLHRFHDDVSDLLVQAHDLVVAPVESTLDNGNRILWGIKSRLASATPTIARKYASQKYTEPPSLVQNRHVLLDSLSRRQVTETKAEKPLVATNTKDGPFRGAARVLLQNALLNGVSVMGLDNSTDEAIAFCALKAWAIENELFASFQSEPAFGDAKISPEYRDFARALKRSLDDPDNLSFCLRVLTGKVDAEAISQMSILDLANPKTKEERARAAASHNVVLDGTSKPAPLKDPPTETIPEPSKSRKVETIQSSVRPGSTEVSESVSSPGAAIEVDVDSSGSAFKHADVVKNPAASNHRPPPPPSLAASLVAVPSASKKSDIPVTNASGTDRSNVTVSVASFVAGFVVETDPFDKAVGFLPENWIEKGRLRNEEFAKFLRSKVEGGKWSVVTYRMITFSNKDERELKKYVKEYESRNRLAMFSLAAESKVFLVTPKFHSSVRSLSFDNASSTYAVALVRR
jgi:Transcription factor S-II (TFIIS), central domain